MNCQNCEYPILPSDEKCPHCGAVPLPRRVTFGARREEFALTREEEPFELGDVAQAEDWQSPVEQKSEPERLVTDPRAHRYQKFIGVAFFAAFVHSCLMSS
jgi:hypothetical protein